MQVSGDVTLKKTRSFRFVDGKEITLFQKILKLMRKRPLKKHALPQRPVIVDF